MLLKDYISAAKHLRQKPKNGETLMDILFTPPPAMRGRNPATMLRVVLTSAGRSTNQPKKLKKKLVSIS